MNIYTGLLFLDGHVADPRLASDLAGRAGEADGLAVDEAPRIPRRSERRARFPGGFGRGAVRLFRNLEFLGGRPMTAGHNDDVDEPFPQPHGERAAPRRVARDTARMASRRPSCARC